MGKYSTRRPKESRRQRGGGILDSIKGWSANIKNNTMNLWSKTRRRDPSCPPCDPKPSIVDEAQLTNPQESEPLPQESEPLPQESEPLPQESEPLPQESEPLPQDEALSRSNENRLTTQPIESPVVAPINTDNSSAFFSARNSSNPAAVSYRERPVDNGLTRDDIGARQETRFNSHLGGYRNRQTRKKKRPRRKNRRGKSRSVRRLQKRKHH
jgi:hypothetical protein